MHANKFVKQEELFSFPTLTFTLRYSTYWSVVKFNLVHELVNLLSSIYEKPNFPYQFHGE